VTRDPRVENLKPGETEDWLEKSSFSSLIFGFDLRHTQEKK